jgi:hypothetical protein
VDAHPLDGVLERLHAAGGAVPLLAERRELGPGPGGLLLQVEKLHPEVDLLLLDLLPGLGELGPLLGELALEDLGVEAQDSVALLDRLALGGEERDLEVGHDGGDQPPSRPHRVDPRRTTRGGPGRRVAVRSIVPPSRGSFDS